MLQGVSTNITQSGTGNTVSQYFTVSAGQTAYQVSGVGGEGGEGERKGRGGAGRGEEGQEQVLSPLVDG